MTHSKTYASCWQQSKQAPISVFSSFITTCFNKKTGDAPPGTRKEKERDPLSMTEMGLLKLYRGQHHCAYNLMIKGRSNRWIVVLQNH
jgi:hypothetical protein